MFRGYQCRFDHTRDRRRNIILKLEDICELGIEAISPEIGAVGRIKQLHSNADAVSSLPNRAFQHIQDAKLSADLLYVYGSILVGKARISGDYKEPADA